MAASSSSSSPPAARRETKEIKEDTGVSSDVTAKIFSNFNKLFEPAYITPAEEKEMIDYFRTKLTDDPTNADNQYHLGCILAFNWDPIDHTGTNIKHTEGVKLLISASEQGHLKAPREVRDLIRKLNLPLASILNPDQKISSLDIDKSPIPDIMHYYRIGAERGNVSDMIYLSKVLIADGKDKSKLQEGIGWCEKAAAKGGAREIFYLGKAYVNHVPEKILEGLTLLRQAAILGDKDATFELTQLYSKVTPHMDVKEVVKWRYKHVLQERLAYRPYGLLKLAQEFATGVTASESKVSSFKSAELATQFFYEAAVFQAIAQGQADYKPSTINPVTIDRITEEMQKALSRFPEPLSIVTRINIYAILALKDSRKTRDLNNLINTDIDHLRTFQRYFLTLSETIKAYMLAFIDPTILKDIRELGVAEEISATHLPKDLLRLVADFLPSSEQDYLLLEKQFKEDAEMYLISLMSHLSPFRSHPNLKRFVNTCALQINSDSTAEEKFIKLQELSSTLQGIKKALAAQATPSSASGPLAVTSQKVLKAINDIEKDQQTFLDFLKTHATYPYVGHVSPRLLR